MNDIAIRVESLGKQYRIGKRERYRTLRDTLTDTVTAPFRWLRNGRSANGNGLPDHIWALRDVSFEIPRGEVVGIIGRNGAGKSTLLKVLSRITAPTEGRAEIHGRVGSLLEVGTGFHPELTGRDNIYLNGAILGMRKAEIARKFDEIVAFSEIEKFLDTPVKRYSSGMYMRLAFAVAAHLEPEILVVDEVLSVGDASFQKKCIGKMGQISREGRTVLFVTHNMVALQSLCTRAICLVSGSVGDDGVAGRVVSNYLQVESPSSHERVWENPDVAPGDDTVRLRAVRLVPRSSALPRTITLETPMDLEITFSNLVSGAILNTTITLYNLEDVCVLNTYSDPSPRPVGLIREVCELPGGLLNDSVYRIRLLIVKDASRCLVNIPDVVSFEVVEGERCDPWYGKWVGAVRPNIPWRSQLIYEDNDTANRFVRSCD
jgi:lipopolysaccharide transport system ATP-binding protein